MFQIALLLMAERFQTAMRCRGFGEEGLGWGGGVGGGGGLDEILR